MNKRDSIYETALRLFNENGFDRTPTARIAKESGVAIGTLFHYFSTKEELINSLYLKCKDSMIGKMLGGTSEEKAYRGKLKRIYSNFLHWSTECTGEFLFFQQFSNSVHINAKTISCGLTLILTIYGTLIIACIRTQISAQNGFTLSLPKWNIFQTV
jgi:AcrR family transcriptional regulator